MTARTSEKQKSEEGICSIVCEAGNQKISCKQHEKQNYIQKVSSAVRPGPGQSPDKADFTFVKKKQNPESQIAGNCEHIDDHNPQVGIRYKYTEYRADGKQYS